MQLVHPRRAPRRLVAGVVALGVAAVPAIATSAGAAGVDIPATPAPVPVAGDAPWTKTVTWLVGELTPAEKVTVLFRGTDPDAHGQAGYLAPIARLGISETRHVDALGVNVRADATGFPTRLGLASSFDRSAYTTLGEQVGKEGMNADLNLIYGPQVDLARFPSWSRNLTTNGEDAYLSGVFSATEINGIQSTGLMSQVKHVAFYNGQSQSVPSLLSSQSAHEVYLLPTQTAIEDANVTSVMCSYATFRIVGEESVPNYACSNSNLNHNILKTQFNLKGFITSDYTAAKNVSDLLKGMDNEFATSHFSNLLPLIEPTSSSFDPDYAKAADQAVARMLYQYERFGLLDNSKIPAAYRSAIPQHGDVTSTNNAVTIDKAEGSRVSLDLARRSGVLLKNNGNALPLSTSAKVAVVGPTATLMPASPGGERSRGFGDRNNYSPLDAIRDAVGTANVTSAPGVDWYGTTIPSAALRTTDDATGVPGLVRTAVAPDGTTTTQTDTMLDGRQSNLLRNHRYTWTGYLNVATADNYQLLFQRPYGTDNTLNAANPATRASYNQGFAPASAGTVTFNIDGGANQTLANPGGNILQNTIPDGAYAANGQYFGKDNTGVALDLSAGLHKITITYNPSINAATTPTFRFAWAPLNQNTEAAKAAARAADTTIIFADDSNPGTTAGAGPNSSVSAALRQINAKQAKLITDVAAAARGVGKKTVLVMNSGTAVAMPFAPQVDAILEMWYPGQEGGTATADLLYGKYNPSGRLPMTFPVDDNATPFTNHPAWTDGTQEPGEATRTIKWGDGVNVGYRWYTDPASNVNGYKPRFAFGYGLSYTTFDLGGLAVKNAADGGLDVTFTVTNTGSRRGGTAPQIYLGPSPDLKAPVYDANGLVIDGFQQSEMKLVQFDHVDLEPGASKTETLHVDVQQLSAWDTKAQKWVLGTGDRKVMLAAASNDIKQTVTKNVPASLKAPTVTTNPPANVTANVGATVSLSAAATGTPTPTVRWQRSVDGMAWTDVPGATSTTYTFTAAAADDGVRVRAVFTNDLGSAMTTAATVHVTRPALTAPVLSATAGVVSAGGKQWTRGGVTLSWTSAGASVARYEVLNGSTVLASLPPTRTSLTVSLDQGAVAHQLSVRAVPVDALVPGGAKTSNVLSVTVDKTGPIVKLTPPAAPDQVASWTKVSGTATDSGSGPAKAVFYLVELRGSTYYAYQSGKWVAASNLADAKEKAIRITAPVSSTGTWSASVTGVAKGILRVYWSGADKVGNWAPTVVETFTVR